MARQADGNLTTADRVLWVRELSDLGLLPARVSAVAVPIDPVERRSPQQVCESKAKYFSPNLAARVADRAMQRERRTGNGWVLRVYKCDCSEQGRPHYHLTKQTNHQEAS